MHLFYCNSHYVDYHLMFKSIHFVSISLLFFCRWINRLLTVKSFTQVNTMVVDVQSLSHVWLFETPWTEACQASLSFTNSGACSNSCPLSRWCHPTLSSSVVPFSSCLQSLLASGSFLMSSSLHQVAKVLELQLQHQSFQWVLVLWRIFSNTTVQNINSSVQWPILVNLLVLLILFSTWNISFLFNSILIDSKSHPVLFFIHLN